MHTLPFSVSLGAPLCSGLTDIQQNKVLAVMARLLGKASIGFTKCKLPCTIACNTRVWLTDWLDSKAALSQDDTLTTQTIYKLAKAKSCPRVLARY